MGIYDRDYYRQERSGFSLGAPRSAVATLILINAAVFLADALFFDNTLSYMLSTRVGTLTHPWLWWEFLTYGFAHDPRNLQHIFFNMLALWFLGRDVEELYGSKEFVRLYLATIVVGGVVWAVAGKLSGLPDTVNLRHFGDVHVLGASGAITGIVVLYALNFPRRMMLFMFVIPMPAWVLGFLVVLMDIYGAMHGADAHVAYTVHLAGAAFAFLYYQQRWNFGRLVPGSFRWPRLGGRPRLRVHDPEPEDDDNAVPEDEVDRILEKIHREGENSLSRKERRILETASREYQRRRRPE